MPAPDKPAVCEVRRIFASMLLVRDRLELDLAEGGRVLGEARKLLDGYVKINRRFVQVSSFWVA